MKKDRMHVVHRPEEGSKLSAAVQFCRDNNAVLMCKSEEQAEQLRSEQGIRATFIRERVKA